jgi:hypothetical protein
MSERASDRILPPMLVRAPVALGPSAGHSEPPLSACRRQLAHAATATEQQAPSRPHRRRSLVVRLEARRDADCEG